MRLVAFGMLCCLATGCAGPPTSVAPVTATARVQQIKTVPFFPDETDQCAWASLAGVLAYWHAVGDPAALKRDVYVAKIGGAMPIDLLLAARRHGMRAEARTGDLETMKAEIDAGRPVIAFLNLGFAVYPRGHYVIVTGYDDRRGGVHVHSGRSPHRFMTYGAFMKGWEKTGRWMLTIAPPETHSWTAAR